MRPVGQEVELERVELPLEEALGDLPHRMPIEILVRRERAEIEQVGELQRQFFSRLVWWASADASELLARRLSLTIGGGSSRISGSRGLSSTKYGPGAAGDAAVEILLLSSV